MRVYTGIIAAGSKFVQRPYCLDRPIKIDDEIEKVLENAEEKHDHGETVSLWPSGSRPAEFRSTSLQLGLEETRDLESDLIRESELPCRVHLLLPIQARPRSPWITAEEADDGPKQRSRRSLQLLKKIDPEFFGRNMPPPPRHDLARVRTQENPGTQQSPNHFLDIGDVEWVT